MNFLLHLYYVPVQTIVSPYDAKCVTPLIYRTIDLDFIVWIIVSFDWSFFYFLQPLKSHNLFVNDIIPPLLLQNKAKLYIVTCTRLYILLSFIEIIKAWPLCVLWTRGHAYIELKRLDNDIKTKSISKTCTNDETKRKPRKKVPHRCIKPACITKNQCGAERSTAETSRPPSHRYHRAL